MSHPRSPRRLRPSGDESEQQEPAASVIEPQFAVPRLAMTRRSPHAAG